MKILKKISFTFIGGQGADIAVKYGFDYNPSYQSRTISLGAATVSEYGIAQYNIDEYASGIVFANNKVQASGSGNVLQLGFEADINNFELSLQKLDCYVKAGRTR